MKHAASSAWIFGFSLLVALAALAALLAIIHH